MKTATRLNPDLWEACKKEAVYKMGKFSARAMQYAVTLYKKREVSMLVRKTLRIV